MSLQQITSKLTELRELREKATQGEWVTQQKGLSNSSDPYVFDRTYGSTLYAERGPSRQENCEFTCEAANNWLTLIACLEKAVGALADLSERGRSNYTKEALVAVSEETLTEISEMLKVGK